jgi:ELWxxDGT repeat protein
VFRLCCLFCARKGPGFRSGTFFWLIAAALLQKGEARDYTVVTPLDVQVNNLPVEYGGLAWFSGTDNTHGYELWVSDGTPSGTRILKDIYPGPESSAPSHLAAFGTKLLFFARTEEFGDELWISDGSPEGTTMVRDINPGIRGSLDAISSGFQQLGDQMLFSADDGVHGNAIWSTDGTESGTVLIKDLYTGPESSNWNFMYPSLFRDRIFFSADDGVHGRELWITDGSTEGTFLFKDIAPGLEGSHVKAFTILDDLLFFEASDGVHNIELWRSDGTVEGTCMVKDIRPGEWGSILGALHVHEGKLYFSADDGVHGWELWCSDGTEAGTALVRDVLPGPDSSFPNSFSTFSGLMYFSASLGDANYRYRLPWFSDGTSEGSRALLTERSQLELLYFSYGVLEDFIYFWRIGEDRRYTLWASDGSPSGTAVVHRNPIVCESCENRDLYRCLPSEFRKINGKLYFFLNENWSMYSPAWGVLQCISLEDRIFQRGDANDDGVMNISDGIHILEWLFEEAAIGCVAAADLNQDSQGDLADVVYLLNFLFREGPAPGQPTGGCGPLNWPGDHIATCNESLLSCAE